MTFTDWVIDLVLIGLVVLQLRGRRLTTRSLLLPVVLVAWAGASYLRAIPTSGNGLVLVVSAVVVGSALGIGAGVLTRVYRDAVGAVVAKATIAAAALWLLGVGARLAFQLYATHGGGAALVDFSARHQLDIAAWTSAILLMAISEVLARTAVLWWRRREQDRSGPYAAVVSSHGG